MGGGYSVEAGSMNHQGVNANQPNQPAVDDGEYFFTNDSIHTTECDSCCYACNYDPKCWQIIGKTRKHYEPLVGFVAIVVLIFALLSNKPLVIPSLFAETTEVVAAMNPLGIGFMVSYSLTTFLGLLAMKEDLPAKHKSYLHYLLLALNIMAIITVSTDVWNPYDLSYEITDLNGLAELRNECIAAGGIVPSLFITLL